MDGQVQGRLSYYTLLGHALWRKVGLRKLPYPSQNALFPALTPASAIDLGIGHSSAVVSS